MVLQLLLLRLMEYAVDHAGDLLPAKPRPRTTGKVIHLHEWRERQ
jgi:hypothetical protein